MAMNRENVLEPWAIYDTILICHDFYGSESTVQGWFTTMAAFAARDRHTFFKGRNEAVCGLAYNNMQTMDKLDFAFHCFSIGLRFFGACSMIEEVDVPGSTNQCQLSPFFMYDLPLHSGVDLKIGQDTKYEGNGYMCPPGYGSQAMGIGNGKDTYTAYNGYPIAIQAGTQGTARKKNRFHFDSPIPIPRNETIEATLFLAEVVTRFLTNTAGPWQNGSAFYNVAALDKELYYTRYGVQMSLYGVREVQQRGQLHV